MKPKKRAEHDVNIIAARIVGIATGAVPAPAKPSEAAVKRGEARAARLSPRRRKLIAKKAAAARWKK